MGLTGCMAMTSDDFTDKSPKFVLEKYFHGKTRAWGLFEDRFGNVRRQFVVDINGNWDGTILTLDEGGAVRRWTWVKLNQFAIIRKWNWAKLRQAGTIQGWSLAKLGQVGCQGQSGTIARGLIQLNVRVWSSWRQGRLVFRKSRSQGRLFLANMLTFCANSNK